jgi:hypothetical protein
MQQRATSAPVRRAEQLQLWPERVRGLPNSLARCALFTAGSAKSERKRYARDMIASLQGTDIHYTGEELRQDDQDVFLQIVHLGRSHKVGDDFAVTGHMILTALGWGRGKDKYLRLRQTIARLVEGTVWISANEGRRGYTGRLIDNLKWVDTDGEITEPGEGDGRNVRWQFRLDPQMVSLFGEHSFTLIDWEQRLSLSPLEKWLHSFYFTHRAPYPYKVATLYDLCGSKVQKIRQFRYMLREALDKLCAPEIAFLESYTIDAKTDLVTVRRKQQPALA